MAPYTQDRTQLFRNRARETVYGVGLLQPTYSAAVVLSPRGDDGEESSASGGGQPLRDAQQLLRDSFEDVRASPLIGNNSFQPAVKQIRIYRSLLKELPGGNVFPIDGAVDYEGDKGYLVFSQDGVRDAWTRFQFIAHSLSRWDWPPPAGLSDADLVEATIGGLLGTAFPGHPEAPRQTWQRIRCDVEIFQAFRGSDGYLEARQSDQRQWELKASYLLLKKCREQRQTAARPDADWCGCFAGGHH